MAGSYNHCATDEGIYYGVGLLDHMGDAVEAIEEMFFMIHYLTNSDLALIEQASAAYYRCCRGEEPWPQYMKPGIESQED